MNKVISLLGLQDNKKRSEFISSYVDGAMKILQSIAVSRTSSKGKFKTMERELRSYLFSVIEKSYSGTPNFKTKKVECEELGILVKEYEDPDINWLFQGLYLALRIIGYKVLMGQQTLVDFIHLGGYVDIKGYDHLDGEFKVQYIIGVGLGIEES